MVYEFAHGLHAVLSGQDGLLVCHGLPAGLPVDPAAMAQAAAQMGPWDDLPGRDPGRPEVTAGIKCGVTDGGPLVIRLTPALSRAAEEGLPFRPSRPDFALWAKWGGRPARREAYRELALLAALGGLLRAALESMGICIGTHIAQCGDVRDSDLPECDEETLRAQLAGLAAQALPMLDDEQAGEIDALIREAQEAGDTLGGTLETAAIGLPAGLGSVDGDGLEARLARALFALPGVKGVELGMGFGFAYLCGSEANDQLVAEDGRIRTKSNLAGGVLDGMTNGMPLFFRTVFRPDPTVAAKQQTVDPDTLEERELTLDGPYDTMAFRRARPAVEGVTAAVLLGLLLERETGRRPDASCREGR